MNCIIKQLWIGKLETKFNTLSVGLIFRYSTPSIVVGCEDGVAQIYEVPCSQVGHGLKLRSKLETKGGPIQTLAIQDVTKFHLNDLIVADSRGTVTVFCNEQIVNRRMVSDHCINCLQVEQDALGNLAIVTGDTEGHIFAYCPYDNLWRLRLGDIRQLKGITYTPSVQSLLTVNLTNASGQTTNYILASDNRCHLFFIQQGSIVTVLDTPAPVNAMCSGKFLEQESTGVEGISNGTSNTNLTQVALGTDTGAIYIMSNFQVYLDEYINVQLPITQLQCIAATERQQMDSILCAGNFNALLVLHEGKEIGRYTTPDWINSLVTADLDSDGQSEVIIGCLDNSVQMLKLTFPEK